MIHYTRSKFARLIDMPLAANHGVTGAGQPLMQVMENGVGKAALHDATAGKAVIGFSVFKPGPETTLSFAQTFNVDSTLPVQTLAYTPTGTPTAYDKTLNAVVTVGASAAAAQVGLVGTQLTLHSSMAGHDIVLIYSFSPTITQLRMLQGDQEPGGVVSLNLSIIGCMKQGTLYTSAFESNMLWYTYNVGTNYLNISSAGKVGLGTTGAPVPNGQVLNAPAGDIPFVGFSFSC